MTLREYIEIDISNNGPIPFARYMQLCLYGEPGSPPGYYSREREQFGKSGDFYTSSDVHAVYGRLLARQFEQMWQVMGKPDRVEVIEFGPGRGFFAADVLAWADKKFPDFAKTIRYALVEGSATFRERLQQRFSGESRVSIRESAQPAFACASDHVIVFGNEFFDALPTEVLDSRGELRVSMKDGKFDEQFIPASPEVTAYVEEFAVPPQAGERVDAPIIAQQSMHEISTLLQKKKGYAVFVDYGYVRDEMLAGRHMGTVTSFRQHTICDSPYEAPGEQDITVHVNFTALAAAAREHGLDPLAWLTQSQFLIGIGEESQFAEAFEECILPQEHAKRALQLKHLITPEGMGESFHVLVLSSNLDKEKAARLDGLKFVRPSNRI